MTLEFWQRDGLNAAIAAARAVQENHPDYPSALAPVSVAQFILESDWGRKHLDDGNNYFGIKAKEGEPFVTRQTREFIAGRYTTVTAKFARYASMESCFEAHADLIVNGTWRETGSPIYSAALAHPDDPEAFAKSLTGVYATDPEYGAKLVALMRDNSLITEDGSSNV